MQELITPQQSEKFVAVAALLIAVVGMAWGYRAVGVRGVLAGLCGPLVYGLWQFHKHITRFDPGFDANGKFDPGREYFGLDKVKVLLFEIVLFIVLGAALGWAWGMISKVKERQNN
jgi:hypothetical protein